MLQIVNLFQKELKKKMTELYFDYFGFHERCFDLISNLGQQFPILQVDIGPLGSRNEDTGPMSLVQNSIREVCDAGDVPSIRILKFGSGADTEPLRAAATFINDSVRKSGDEALMKIG